MFGKQLETARAVNLRTSSFVFIVIIVPKVNRNVKLFHVCSSVETLLAGVFIHKEKLMFTM